MPEPIIAFTPGEPAGVGPDIAIDYATQDKSIDLLVFADPALLIERAEIKKKPVNIIEVDPTHPNPETLQQARSSGMLAVATGHQLSEKCIAGTLNTHNAPYVLETLKHAAQSCIQGDCQALVTGPVNKGHLNNSGIPFSGHTEYLAELSNTPHPVMMLSTEGLSIALATTHLPLKNVADAITPDLLRTTLEIIHSSLSQYFTAGKAPCIYVCGLNPHAGDNGALGQEEQAIIEPVIHTLQQNGYNIVGPLSADTIFSPENLESADVFLAMYHDQGLPVLKYKGFSNAINITLGLNFIRTSVDHGTALEIAGTDQVNTQSFELALKTAIHMVNTRDRN